MIQWNFLTKFVFCIADIIPDIILSFNNTFCYYIVYSQFMKSNHSVDIFTVNNHSMSLQLLIMPQLLLIIESRAWVRGEFWNDIDAKQGQNFGQIVSK